MIRILTADDHAIVREGLKQILADSPNMQVVDEAESGEGTLEKIRTNDYDVVVLDISMPGKSGLEVLKEIKAVRPSLPILILTIHPEEQYAVRVLRAGASGYLTKESAPDELVNAIERVSSGKKYITPATAERLVNELGSSTEKPSHNLLSDREFEVMRMLALGRSVKQIAEKLEVSPKTISTYKYRIFEKMDLRSSAELARYAIENGLLD